MASMEPLSARRSSTPVTRSPRGPVGPPEYNPRARSGLLDREVRVHPHAVVALDVALQDIVPRLEIHRQRCRVSALDILELVDEHRVLGVDDEVVLTHLDLTGRGVGGQDVEHVYFRTLVRDGEGDGAGRYGSGIDVHVLGVHI